MNMNKSFDVLYYHLEWAAGVWWLEFFFVSTSKSRGTSTSTWIDDERWPIFRSIESERLRVLADVNLLDHMSLRWHQWKRAYKYWNWNGSFLTESHEHEGYQIKRRLEILLRRLVVRCSWTYSWFILIILIILNCFSSTISVLLLRLYSGVTRRKQNKISSEKK